MSATATLNSRTSAQSAAKSIPGLPAASRLLPRRPAEEADAEHPPIYMKLNSSILALLADGASPPKISLEVSDKSKALRIGNFEYQGSLYKEPGYLEVYLPETAAARDASAASERVPRFRSCGQVRNRMTIKQDKPIKIASETGPVDLSQPTEQRIMQLLMLGPAQPQDLAAKAEASRELVDAVLAETAEPRVAGSAHYILKRQFQLMLEARDENEPAAGTKQRDDVPAKPERVTKTLKELREARAATNSAANGSAAGTGTSNGGTHGLGVAAGASGAGASPPESADAGRKANSVPPPDATRDRLKVAMKRRAPVVAEDEPKRARSEAPRSLPARQSSAKQKDAPEEDMFEIARKFKSAYGEYLELYSRLSKRKARPASQVEKLMTMHRQLERWKNTLWTNARNKRMVN